MTNILQVNASKLPVVSAQRKIFVIRSLEEVPPPASITLTGHLAAKLGKCSLKAKKERESKLESPKALGSSGRRADESNVRCRGDRKGKIEAKCECKWSKLRGGGAKKRREKV